MSMHSLKNILKRAFRIAEDNFDKTMISKALVQQRKEEPNAHFSIFLYHIGNKLLIITFQ